MPRLSGRAKLYTQLAARGIVSVRTCHITMRESVKIKDAIKANGWRKHGDDAMNRDPMYTIIYCEYRIQSIRFSTKQVAGETSGSCSQTGASLFVSCVTLTSASVVVPAMRSP